MVTVIGIGIVAVFAFVVLRAEGDESIGLGSTYEINDGGGNSFQAVGKIESLGVPNETTNMLESKTLDLANATIRKIAALKDGGTFDVRYQTTAETFTRLDALRDARVEKLHKISIVVDVGTVEITVPGTIVSNKHDDVEPDKINTATATISVNGPHQ